MTRFSVSAVLATLSIGLACALAWAGSGVTSMKSSSGCGCVDCRCPNCNGGVCSCVVCECGSCGCTMAAGVVPVTKTAACCAQSVQGSAIPKACTAKLESTAASSACEGCACPDCNGETCSCDVCACGVCGCSQ